GAVRAYLRHFWDAWSAPGWSLPEADLGALVARYAPPGAMTASLGWYRAGAGTVARSLTDTAPAPAARTRTPTHVLSPRHDPPPPPRRPRRPPPRPPPRPHRSRRPRRPRRRSTCCRPRGGAPSPRGRSRGPPGSTRTPCAATSATAGPAPSWRWRCGSRRQPAA